MYLFSGLKVYMNKIISVNFKSLDDGNVYVSTDEPKFYHNKIGPNVKVELLCSKKDVCNVRNLETEELCTVPSRIFNKYFSKLENANNVVDDQTIENSTCEWGYFLLCAGYEFE